MELPRPLNENEVVFVQSFTSTAERLAKTRGVFADFDIYSISQEAGIEVRDLPKEGILIQAIWVSFLSVLRAHLPKSELKYQSLPGFLETYRGQFDDCSPTEMQNLMDTANWMNILFRFIPAKKNKGLAIAIIPKLIEGWLTKYVTGSGQKRATADRVKIFETEGQVKPNQRGKIKPSTSRHSTSSNGSGSGSTTKMHKRVVRKESGYIKKKKLAGSLAPASVPMMLDAPDQDAVYVHGQHSDAVAFYPLQLPYLNNPAVHDNTDTDHESSEEISGRTDETDATYEFDFEGHPDNFFTCYEEMLDNPGSAPPGQQGPAMNVVDENNYDDIDFAEVLRLIRDPSTPNLNNMRPASNSNMTLTRMSGASPRTRGFTSPHSLSLSSSQTNGMSLSSQAMSMSSPAALMPSSNGFPLPIPVIKRSISQTSGVSIAYEQPSDPLSSTRVATDADTDDEEDDDNDDEMDEESEEGNGGMHMEDHENEPACVQFIPSTSGVAPAVAGVAM